MILAGRLVAPLLFAICAVVTQPDRVSANEPGWFESFSLIFSPNRVAQSAIQLGIQTARGFADITYQDLSVDILSSKVSLRQIKIRPFPDWDDAGECIVKIDRADLNGTPFLGVDEYTGELVLQGVSAPLVCLPVEMRLSAIAVGQEVIGLSLLRSNFEYDFSDSSLLIKTVARIPKFAAMEIRANIDYISNWSREQPSDPLVLYLNSAQMRVENLGGWEALKPALPPSLTDLSSGGEAFEALLKSVLESENLLSDPISDAQSSFLESSASTWSDFLADPGQLTFSLLQDDNQSRFIDFWGLGDDGYDMFEELQPAFSTGWRQIAEMVSKQMVTAALGGEAGLEDDEKLQVARALISGVGAPRNTSLGVDILQELAMSGNIQAKELLARTLFAKDVESSYYWALQAAAGGSSGAVALLDQLEEKMTWDAVEKLQPNLVYDGTLKIESDKDVAVVRSQASAAMLGQGLQRSYAQALYWSLLGKAFGDQESAWLVGEIERRVQALESDEISDFLKQIEDAAFKFWVEARDHEP